MTFKLNYKNLELKNLVSFKKLYKKLLKHQNVNIDIAKLLRAYKQPHMQLNGFDTESCKQYKDWLNFNNNLFQNPEYKHAKDTLLFAIKLTTDYYADKAHYTGNVINDDFIIYNFETICVHTDCANLIKTRYIYESSPYTQELNIYKSQLDHGLET